MVGGCTAAALWGAVSRTCSSFFSIRLVSVHIAVSTWPRLGRNCASFYRSDLTCIWPIVYRKLSTPLLVVCRCLFRLMRHCFLGRSTSFRELLFSVEMSPVGLKHIYSVLCALTWRPMPAAARSRQMQKYRCKNYRFSRFFFYIKINTHLSLSLIASGRSSRRHPTSVESWCM